MVKLKRSKSGKAYDGCVKKKLRKGETDNEPGEKGHRVGSWESLGNVLEDSQ